jgi:hypothetical protein
VCGVERLASQKTPCNIYSFGVNHDSSFEAAFLRQAPNCQIWGYDFSVKEWGPQIQEDPALLASAHFFPYKAAALDKPHSSPPEYSIETIMRENGHGFIDILKIDIEGSEFSVLDAFLRPYTLPDSPPLPVGQLEIEIHAWGAYTNFEVFNPWWELLEQAGFRPFWTEPNLPKVSHMKSLPDTAEVGCFRILWNAKVLIGSCFCSIRSSTYGAAIPLFPTTTSWFPSSTIMPMGFIIVLCIVWTIVSVIHHYTVSLYLYQGSHMRHPEHYSTFHWYTHIS